MKITRRIVCLTIAICLEVFLICGMEKYGEAQNMKTLRSCPSSPNCVSSQADDKEHRMEPMSYTGSMKDAQEKLKKVITDMPRSQIMIDEPGYMNIYFRSRIFGFVDEVEFSFDEQTSRINFRSAAHSGYYDFGVNRSRMHSIAAAFYASK